MSDTLRPMGFLPSADGYVGHELYSAARPGLLAMPGYVCQPTLAIRDQRSVSSCVGVSTATALRDRLLIQGSEVVEFSPWWPYLGARLLGAARRGLTRDAARFMDDGCSPQDAMAYLDSAGYCAEKWWPYDSGLPSDEPPVEALRHAWDQRGRAKMRRIYSADDIRHALAAGHTITVAGPLDSAYQRYSGGVWQGVTGPVIGLHQRRIVAYLPSGDFVEAGSWSEEHGVSYAEATDGLAPSHSAVGGFVRVSADAYDDAREIYAFEWAADPSELAEGA